MLALRDLLGNALSSSLWRETLLGLLRSLLGLLRCLLGLLRCLLGLLRCLLGLLRSLRGRSLRRFGRRGRHRNRLVDEPALCGLLNVLFRVLLLLSVLLGHRSSPPRVGLGTGKSSRRSIINP